MTTGLTMSINNKAQMRKKLAAKAKNSLYNLTIKYFWYTILYLLFIAITSMFNIQFKIANLILTIITMLFSRPQKLVESIATKINKSKEKTIIPLASQQSK